jgi:predicted ATPase
VGGVLDALGRRRPTALVVEDARRTDDGTLDLLRFLARRISPVDAVVLVT